jgi:Na+/phosphate symporter
LRIHEEEKNLTNAIVCRPTTTADVLKAVVLFPGKLERSGDLLESVVNCAKIKARDGILFSDKALAEVERLFGALSSVIENFRDLLSTLNPTLLGIVTKGCNDVIQMTLDFAVSHEDRLIEGLCSPKASSLYLDVLDSVRGVSRRILEMNESLEKIAATYQTH